MILVIAQKHLYSTRRILEEAKKIGVALEILEPGTLLTSGFKLDVLQYALLYVRSPYVNKSPKAILAVIALAQQFVQAGKPVIDANIATGDLGLGKWHEYQCLQRADIALPKTIKLGDNSQVEHLATSYHLPATKLILKWIYGMKARDVFFVRTKQELQRVLSKHPLQEWLLQEYIEAEYEYKVITVGYKSLPVVLRFRTQATGFKIDFQSAETCVSDTLPDVVKLAEQAARATGRELAKVDIVSRAGNLYVLEVNRTPGLDSFESLTKYNVFADFLKYLKSGIINI